MKKNKGLLIIAVHSGLGNQMFQYAFYKYLLSKGYNVYLDIITYYEKMLCKKHETYRLEYFNLPDIKFVCKKDKDRFYTDFLPFFEAIKGKNIILVILITLKRICKKLGEMLGLKLINKIHWVEWNHGKIFYQTELQYNTRAYMIGCYQEYSYLENLRNQLLENFKFTIEIPGTIKKTIDVISNEHSVAIHVRRGDYVGTEEFDVCSVLYYRNAIEHLTALKMDLTYYIFSDDIAWVKSNFCFIEKYQIIDNSGHENSDYFDLCLMSKCKHNITANSTFSWWGAWLNQNPEKIVIVPEKWNGYDFILTDKICPPEWKRMATQ